MDYFSDSNWVEAPKDFPSDDVVKFMVDSGAVSSESPSPSKKSTKTTSKKVTLSPPSSPTQHVLPLDVPLIESSFPDEKPVIYTNSAYDAFTLLSRSSSPSYVYHTQSWWRYDSDFGWIPALDSDMAHDVADYLVDRQSKIDSNEVNKILLAMTHFCKLRFSEDIFEPTFFLSSTNGVLSSEHSPGWLACRNALLHVPTVARYLYRGLPIPEDSILPLNSNLFVKGRIPCDFNPDATCVNWETFLSQSCPFDQLCLQELFGLSLTYDRSFNAFFIIYGPAGSGKSTCLNVLQRLNQGSVSQVSLGRFGERFYIYPLSQNRLNVVHDMDSIFEGDGSVSLREAVLKSVSSGESLEIERKHRQAHRDYLRALCVFGTNSLPRFADKSDAISQRMRIIQFPNQFRNTENQVRDLSSILYHELDGIFLWALRGYGYLLESHSNIVDESSEAISIKSDSIKDSRPEIQFCDECLEFDDLSGPVSTIFIYKAYTDYCRERGYIPSGMSKVLPLITSYLKIAPPKRVRRFGRLVSCISGVSLIGKEEEF